MAGRPKSGHTNRAQFKAAQLRHCILQAAVQGKLVPQNLHDEPASVLLGRIRAKKALLIKEGKIKKEKPLLPITEDEIPYDLPEGWMWCRLGEICFNIHYGYTAPASKNGNARLLRITDIQESKVCWEQVPFCSISEKNINSYRLNERDILIARTGGTIGKTYLVTEVTGLCVFASYLIRVIPAKALDERYLKLMLESPLYWEQLYTKSMGTGQPNVNGTSLSSLFVPLPPLAEQQRIVAKVDELMDLCEQLKATPDLLVVPPLALTPATLQQVPYEEPELLMAARGRVSRQGSEELRQAQEDLFRE